MKIFCSSLRYKFMRYLTWSRPNARKCSTLVSKKDFDEIQQSTKKSREPFVKNIFIGKFDTAFLSFPQVFTGDELAEMENVIAPFEQFFRDTAQRKQTRDEMKALGAFGLQIPEEYGGTNLNATAYARFCEAISQDVPKATTLAAHQAFGLKGLLMWGDKQQKQKYLPSLASGDCTAAFCFSEPSGGAGTEIINTEAKLSENGEHWCINGRKTLVCGSEKADIITVIAKTKEKDTTEGLTAFVVEQTSEGVTFENTANIGDNTDVTICEVRFKNTPVPTENVLGKVGEAYKLCVDVLGSNRYAAGSFSAGIMRKLLARTTEHCINKKQLGKQLMEFELIQEKIARLVCSIYILESITYLTAGILDSFENPDVSVEAAIVKVLSSQLICNGILECQNILGIEEFFKDDLCNKLFRDSRAFMFLEGSDEVLRMFIALSGLQHAGVAMKETIERARNPFMNPMFSLKRIFSRHSHFLDTPKLTLGLDGFVHPSLQPAAHQLEYSVLKLQFIVEVLLARYGRSIVEKEIELNRLTDIVMGVYSMTAVIARASRSYCIGLQNSEYDVLTAGTICNNIFEMVNQNIKNIYNGPYATLDSSYTRIAHMVYGQKGYFLEHPLTRNF